MRILVSGGTGFIGRTIIPALLNTGHAVTVLSRRPEQTRNLLPSSVIVTSWESLSTLSPDEFTAIINLTGANIAARRWTSTYQNELVSSRLQPLEALLEWCKTSKARPHFYQASAIGYYGLRSCIPAAGGDTESTIIEDKDDHSFSGQLVRRCEQAAMSATAIEMPLTILRFGVVLRHGEGMLKKLELPAKCGLGAVLGDGQQPLSWIDADDLTRIILFLLEHPEISGVINCTAPEVVTQQFFTQTLAATLQRPRFLWLPAPFIKLMFGQMGEELLLSGQAVKPQRLLDLRFTFQYPDLASALRHEYGE